MRALVELVRPGNVLMAAAGTAIGGLLQWTGAAGPLLLTVLAVALAVAGGNALNDVRDEAIDRRAHPKRPLPSGRLPRTTALRVAAFGLATAPFAASLAGGLPFLVVLAGVALVLLYEWRLKGMGLPGNVAVALMVGLTLVAGAASQAVPGAVALSGAVLATLANLARELWKDLEDAPHDVGRRTLARRSPEAATVAARAVSLILAAVSPVPVYAGLDVRGLAGLAPGGLLAFAAVFRRPAEAQRLLKAGMLLALGGLGVGAGLALARA